MTDWVETLTAEVEDILNIKWDVRNGYVVPESDDIVLADGAVKVRATFLYADLAGSSVLAQTCPWETTAKIIRSYLDVSTRLIRAYSGEIRSFDGDRVMGVFMGDQQESHAVRCAREIDWVVEKVIGPKATEKFKSIKTNEIKIKHCVGIDSGEAVAVRAGIRNNNDLVWIGRAPSFAAKLSDIRAYPYTVYISGECYDALGTTDTQVNGESIWEERSIDFAGGKQRAYRTKHMRTP